MNTPISEIYACFFSLIDGVSLHKFENELKVEILGRYLARALALDCRNMKTDTDETVRYTDIEEVGVPLPDGTISKELVFPYHIPETEKWIIASGMVLSWLSPKIHRERLLRSSIGDRDYKESSHGNQLASLIKLYDKAKEDVENYRIDHSFDNFEGFNV